MSAALILLLVVLLVVLAFEYINGFHDTANAIATVVSTKVLTPRQAIILAAVFNLIGAFYGTAVAKTISVGIVDTTQVHMTTLVILCTMLSAIAWNLLTWWFGLPSSSSHALIGALCGTALAASGGKWGVLIWSKEKIDAKGVHSFEGIFHKVVLPMITSPVLGLVVGFLFMGLIFAIIRNWRPHTVNSVFGKLQIASAAYMGLGHGKADAQKTMGMIAVMLFTATQDHTLDGAPAWLGFLHTDSATNIAPWIKCACAGVMAAGTWAGGWRIIKTLGHKMVRMKPVHGFAAETTAATILYVTSELGMPVSTTHTITTSIMGVGAAKRWNSVKWNVVERIVWAWIFTIPVSAGLAYVLYRAVGAVQ